MAQHYLAAFDFDSTLINQEIIDELADRAGKKKEVVAITRAAIEGRIPFEQSLQLRVAALKGISEPDLQAVADAITYRRGFQLLMDWLKAHHFQVAVVSGTFFGVLYRMPHRGHFDEVFANDFIVQKGKLTGRVIANVTENKGFLLRKIQETFGIPKERTFSIGDGITDIPMFKESGFSVALHANLAVQREATLALDVEDLRDLIPHIKRHFFPDLG